MRISDMKQDYTTSNNPRFLYFAEMHLPVPAWVSKEPMPTASAFEKCAAAAFADQTRRLLPIRDKLSAFHSALEVFSNMDSYAEETFERVKSACEFYGIEADVAPYAELFAEKMEKAAAADTPGTGKFAIDQEIGGVAYRILPLNDAEDVTSSASELAKMAAERRIHFLTMVPAAVEIAKAASHFGVKSLPYLVERFGYERLPDFAGARKGIEGRELLSKTADQRAVKEAYEDALSEGESEIISPSECMSKIASIDDAAGLRYRYFRGAPVLTAADIVFSGPLVSEVEKAAREYVAIREVLVPLAVIKSISTEEIDFKLTKEASSSLGRVRDTSDAKDISLVVMEWEDEDQRTLLRLAQNA